MNKNLIILLIFILVALVQWYVPGKMIFEKERVLAAGKEFKFRTEPIDPNDPFRGKYITLTYRENRIPVQKGSEWESNETIYVLLSTDGDGYVKIDSVSKEKPADNPDFVKAKVNYVSNDYVFIDYPFERFYMEETKAPVAEEVYLESIRDTSQVVYALVSVRNGEAVIKDVMINGVPIGELTKDGKGNR